jgi:hypothetical protein
VTKRRECTFPLSYSLLSVHFYLYSLSLSPLALGFLGASWSFGLRFIPWKLEIRVLREIESRESFYNISIHSIIFTLVMRCDQEKRVHISSLLLLLKPSVVLVFTLVMRCDKEKRVHISSFLVSLKSSLVLVFSLS